MRVFLILLLLAVFLAACSQGCKDTWNSIWAILNPPATPTPVANVTGGGSSSGNAPGTGNPGRPTNTPTGPTPCIGCTASPSPSPTPTPILDSEPDKMDDGAWGPKSTILYNLYLRLHREHKDSNGNDTLWWSIYGRDGKFTLVDFTAMVFIREVATAPGLDGINMNDYVEAMGRHSSIWCEKFSNYNCDSTTNKGMIYYLYEWSQTAKGIVTNCTNVELCNLSENFQSIYGRETESWALKIADGIKNPLPEWRNFDQNALYDAGNPHSDVIQSGQVAKMHQMRHNAHYESPDGKFFITTYCETKFLRNEMGLYDGEGCTLPPTY